uniref:Uncharacterized protein n=1 Tax=Chryseobacterium endophyticum TaxID=1854762 RepID=A0AAU6WSP9_9FLAO
MKKTLKIITTILLPLLSLAACKHQAKEEEVVSENVTDAKKDTDHIKKEIYTDDFGDQLEVAINETQNTVVVRLNGKTYELKKAKNSRNSLPVMRFTNFPMCAGRLLS